MRTSARRNRPSERALWVDCGSLGRQGERRLSAHAGYPRRAQRTALEAPKRTAFKPRSAPSSGRALLAVARLLITRRQCSPSSPNPGAAWSRSNLGRAAGALRLPRWSARRRPRRSPSLRGTGSSNPSPSSRESRANRISRRRTLGVAGGREPLSASAARRAPHKVLQSASQ